MKAMKINPVITGRRIYDLRIKNGFTVLQLSKALGLDSTQAVYKWQNGTALPTVENLFKLCYLFNVKAEDIIQFYECSELAA